TRVRVHCRSTRLNAPSSSPIQPICNSHPNQPPDPAAPPGQQHPSSLFHGVQHLRAPPHPLPDPFDLAASTHPIYGHEPPIISSIIDDHEPPI
ncbi:hypothetical protein ACLOJK_014814, partial [Asimina triloba]